MTRPVVELINELSELSLTETFGQDDLSDLVVSDERSEFGQGLFTRTTHTDKQRAGSLSLDDSRDSKQMLQSIIEKHQFQFLGWILLVVSFHQGRNSVSKLIDISNSFVDLWSGFFDLSFFIEFFNSQEIAEENLLFGLKLLHDLTFML
jgi:hypothetical protein